MFSTIDILLPVFNGENFLTELLESLEKQTFQDFRLIIYNDSSTDSSRQLIEHFMNRTFLDCSLYNHKQNIGVIGAVNQLLTLSHADYVMFCDQDDIWFPGKIEKTMNKIHECERKFGKETPLLAFTDLCLVNEQLKIINNSYYRYQNIKTGNCTLNRLLTQNVASGCTMLLNRTLIDLVEQIPPTAVMHDHWFNLASAAFGKMVYLDEPTLYYRQHDRNVFGASAYNWSYFYKRYKSGLDSVRERFYLNVEQAKAFLQQYEQMLSVENCKMLDEFANIGQKNWLERRKVLCRNKIYKFGCRRNIGTMLIV